MKIRSLQGTSNEELLELQSDWLAEETSYRDSITVDYSTWKGAKVVRLNLSAKPWDIYEDEDIEVLATVFKRISTCSHAIATFSQRHHEWRLKN